MKHRILNRSLSFAFAFVASLSAHAGEKIGNGGDGVLIDGRLYSLDLVESGVERDPFFDPDVAPSQKIAQRLREPLSFMDDESFGLLVHKLTEIEKLDALHSLGVEFVARNFRWILLNIPLTNIPDEDTNLAIPEEQLVQVAVRTNKTIQIYRSAWEMMDPANQAALVLHEAFYAMIKGDRWGKQSSPKAREVLGYVFTPDFKKKGKKGFDHIRQGGFENFIARERKNIHTLDPKNFTIHFVYRIHYSVKRTADVYKEVSRFKKRWEKNVQLSGREWHGLNDQGFRQLCLTLELNKDKWSPSLSEREFNEMLKAGKITNLSPWRISWGYTNDESRIEFQNLGQRNGITVVHQDMVFVPGGSSTARSFGQCVESLKRERIKAYEW